MRITVFFCLSYLNRWSSSC